MERPPDPAGAGPLDASRPPDRALTEAGLTLVVGPPGSGKTEAMVAVARSACAAGARVWWLALPHQRASVFRRVTAHGRAVLGLEVLGAQQAYYRVLSALAPGDLRPLVVGTARIVLVGEAVRTALGRLPSPGEAKLFAAAIAEAKRYEVTPDAIADLPHGDGETRGLAAVYAAYEDRLGQSWDYDDVRSRAARFVEQPEPRTLLRSSAGRAAAGLPDVVIVDGWRELGPLDWRFLRALSQAVAVHVALPKAPAGVEPAVVLSARPQATRVERYLAVNPVEEARWVLRSLKRDLACGHDPLELAVVAPARAGDDLLALADEYGVPLTDERGSALADSREGRALVALLELPDAPSPTRLLAIPELAPVADLAMRLGLTGAEALSLVARSMGLEGALSAWLEKLRVGGDPVAWTRWLLNDVLTLGQREVGESFTAPVLSAAQHAASLTSGDDFRRWLVALLTDARGARDQPGGISVLSADLASGRRFTRCYVMGATVGAYEAGEREDYFVPDEDRADEPALGSLPRRFAGADGPLVEELLSRGATTVVTGSTGGTEGKLVPDERLLGDPRTVQRLPPVPAGSALELGGAEVYQPATERLPPEFMAEGFRGAVPDAEWLRVYYEQCGLMAWAGVALGLEEEGGGEAGAEEELRRLLGPVKTGRSEWRGLVEGLRSHPKLTEERLEELAVRYAWAADWLGSYGRLLTLLNWGSVVVDDSGAEVRLDAGRRSRSEGRVDIYRFVEPPPVDWAGQKGEWHWAGAKVRDRWSEYLAARAFLARSREVEAVHVVVWPVTYKPIVFDRSPDNGHMADRMERAAQGAAAAMEGVSRGEARPNPGRWCDRCRLFYVCRLGVRG